MENRARHAAISDYELMGSLAAFVALFSHIWFKTHEPTLMLVAMLLVGGNLLLGSLLATKTRYCFASIVWLSLLANLVYWTTLGLSIAIYRVVLHPLRRFPGPLICKLTKLKAFQVSRSGKSHLWLQELHQQYGDIVRTGPNELSFCAVEAISPIHGAMSKSLAKGPFYDGNAYELGESLSATRSLETHRNRRKIWEPAFSPKALLLYEPRVVHHISVLMKQFEKRSGEVIDFGQWCDYFGFDVMGDLGFSEDFHQLESATPHTYTDLIHQHLKMRATFGHIPWTRNIVPWLLSAKTNEANKDFYKLSRERFQRRREAGKSGKVDVFSYLLDAQEQGLGISDAKLAMDSGAVITGGSDTTAICLNFMFDFLIKDQSTMEKLVAEVDTLWDGEGPPSSGVLARAQYLNGAINESLRLFPPGANRPQRTTPDGGYTVQGEWLPPETQVSVHHYTLLRDLRNFSEPDTFAPERWSDDVRPLDWNHEQRAFIPFSSGQYVCVGKAIALQEIRLFTTMVLKKFTFHFAEEHDHTVFLDGVQSNSSLVKSPLMLVVQRREDDT